MMKKITLASAILLSTTAIVNAGEIVNIITDWDASVTPITITTSFTDNIVNIGNETTPITFTISSVPGAGTILQRLVGTYRAAAGDVEYNTMNISNVTVLPTTPPALDWTIRSAAAWAANGDANHNTLNIHNSTLNNHMVGGLSSRGSANYNTINLHDSIITAGPVDAGHTLAGAIGTTSYNTVNVHGSSLINSSWVGDNNGTGDASHNAFNGYDDGIARSVVIAGFTSNGNTYNNVINLYDNFTITHVQGADAARTQTGSSYNNTVNLHDNVRVLGEVKGARIGVIGNVYNNTVNLYDNAYVESNVYGGWTINGQAYDNTVNINDSATVEANVYGGYSATASQVYGNVVNISGTAIFGETTTIYGGFSAADMSLVTDNTVNFNHYTGSVYNIDGTQTVNVTGGNLTLTNTAMVLQDLNNNGIINVAGSGISGTITIDNYNGTGSFLIDVGSIANDLIIINNSVSSPVHLMLQSDLGLAGLANSIISGTDYKVVTVGSAITGESVVVDPKRSGIYKFGTEKIGNDWWLSSAAFDYKAAELYAQTKLAGLAMVNTSAELAHRMIPVASRNIGIYGKGLSAFVGGQYTDVRYNTGSHIDVKGPTLIAGIAKQMSETITVGVFGEHGNGSYDGVTDYRSKGNVTHYGGGLMGRWQNMKNHAVDATIRVGRQKTDFKSYALDSRFDNSTSNYFGATLGNELKLYNCRNHAWDAYDTIYYAHVKGDKITDNLGQKIELKDVDSLRYRLGTRYGYSLVNAGLKPYVGIAGEYEFLGEAKAYIDGHKADTPSLKGFSTIIEAGATVFRFRNVTFDTNVERYFGTRENWTGNLRLQYNW